MPDKCCQMVCTSPPYWGLRSYGHYRMQTLWGKPDDFQMSRKHPERWWIRIRWRAAERGRGVWNRNGQSWIGALGLEPTIELYVSHIVRVFREVRRVLRSDGCVFLNLGDSYTSGNRPSYDAVGSNLPVRVSRNRPSTPAGLKPKDLCLIPARVALALQADGWWVRSRITWAKGRDGDDILYDTVGPGSSMPGSEGDRPCKADEAIFLLTKSARYYYDDTAVYVEWPGGSHRLRNVWFVNTKSYKEAHFAVFPPRIPEICILAGTSQAGCCPECGKPWERVVEKGLTAHDGETESAYETGSTANRLAMLRQAARKRGGEYANETRTLGWRPGCSCFGKPDQVAWDVQMGLLKYEPVPCLVLDPFSGAGTTVMVALRLGRRAVGIELSEDYVAMSEKRIRADVRAMSRRMI